MLYKKDIYLFIIINKKGYSITIPQLINQLYIHVLYLYSYYLNQETRRSKFMNYIYHNKSLATFDFIVSSKLRYS